jgi:copper chaperone CopZ
MEQTLHIGGMTCQHCQQAAQRAIAQVAGVDEVQVNLESNTALVRGTAALEELREAIEDAGFSLLTAPK